ncbi:hypothetical protein SB861_64415, partial [Paraburkholderia sp. SIMBA_049]
ALRPIIADEVDTLQDGTLDSTAPLLNTVVATEGWLRRFNVQDDQLNGFWVELHKTPKLHSETAWCCGEAAPCDPSCATSLAPWPP